MILAPLILAICICMYEKSQGKTNHMQTKCTKIRGNSSLIYLKKKKKIKDRLHNRAYSFKATAIINVQYFFLKFYYYVTTVAKYVYTILRNHSVHELSLSKKDISKNQRSCSI